MASWTGAVDNQWSNPGNWLEGAAPTGPADLVFPRTTPYNRQEIVVPPEGVTVQSIKQAAGINCGFVGGMVTLSAGVTFDIDTGRLSLKSPTTFLGGMTLKSIGAGSLRIMGPVTGPAEASTFVLDHAVLYFEVDTSLPTVAIDIEHAGGAVLQAVTVTLAAVVGQPGRVQKNFPTSVLNLVG